ncbi:hypothetical protein [Nocardia wallacei]|uniref:hypothetical protein n=1 Tax=Nocardia wallacei TaxID=480035 RepID=UPI0024541CD3|nr:hypothetical protein [Nocardia wallacei]
MSNVVHRMRRVKEIVTWALLVVFGIVALIAGIVMLNSHGKVDCGGKTMDAGDKCVTTGKHGSTTRTAEEQQSKNTKTAWAMVVLGPLFSAGGVFMLRSELRKSKGSAGGGMQPPPNNPQAPQAAHPQWPAPAGHGAAQPYPGHPQPGPSPTGQPHGAGHYPQQPPVPANYAAPQQHPAQPGGYAPMPQYAAPGYGPPPGYPQGPPPGYPQHPGYPQQGPHNPYPPQR